MVCMIIMSPFCLSAAEVMIMKCWWTRWELNPGPSEFMTSSPISGEMLASPTFCQLNYVPYNQSRRSPQFLKNSVRYLGTPRRMIKHSRRCMMIVCISLLQLHEHLDHFSFSSKTRSSFCTPSIFCLSSCVILAIVSHSWRSSLRAFFSSLRLTLFVTRFSI